jgi:hypothetical protein
VPEATLKAAARTRRPSWFARPSDVELDCRKDGSDGMTAIRAVMKEAERLLPGRVMTIRIGFEPTFLCRVLAGRGFDHWPEKIADDQWLIYFLRKPGGFSASRP